MSALSSVTDSPGFQSLYLLLFLVVSAIFAVPPFTIHLFLHPFTYFISTKPLSARLKIARSKFFYYAWRFLSPILDPGDRPNKAPLLARAQGVVLEIGAGVGDNIKYYKRSSVERLIVVEPNHNMHPELRGKANAAGFSEMDGSLLLLGCGGAATDEMALTLAGVGPGSVDTVMAIHVLCGIPGPAAAIEMYRRLLKPGGQLVFYEHVRNEERKTAEWQTWYTEIIWRMAFDGCELNRPTGEWIVKGPSTQMAGTGIGRGGAMVNGTDLEEKGQVKERWSYYHIKAPEGQKRYACTPHVMGWAVKA